ncbi:nucleoside-triphosphate diphosphatase [Streptococcus sciuri]|uniref:dITP/XTP pyrophosphatase n=1 Tax=Streptococcus sciuri TaxID=2973939 RepID=A0ABT2F8M8_9STRE|nr:nucleoside-triphosphate diphosphatase [Streptococcus sciuri]MCS4488837.1 nucleoside-triphosphate diphosphatase [Streptococcus sciuri]
MTENIVEYKDDKDWYVGKIGMDSFNFSSSNEIDSILTSLETLLMDENNKGKIALGIIRYSSPFRLIRFYLNLINTLENRSLSAVSHKGSVLVLEGEKVLFVHIPTDGVGLSHFLDSNAVDFGDTILIATRNEGKTKEFRQLFAKLGISVQNLNDYPDLPEVEETGMTFEENARLKAETISQLTDKMVLADDSGLKVDALGGLPGVWSARFSGPEANDVKNNAKLLHELAMVFELKDRKAQFHTTLVVAAPGKDSLVVEANWEGYIGFEPRGENGFGYDPLFLVGNTGKTAAELSAEEKNSQSHRGKAVQKLMEVFPQWQHNL